MQDTAHGLRLEPLIKSQNQNLELVANLMTDSGGRAVSGCRDQNGMGQCIGSVTTFALTPDGVCLTSDIASHVYNAD